MGMPGTKNGVSELLNCEIHAEAEEFFGTEPHGYEFISALPRFLRLITNTWFDGEGPRAVDLRARYPEKATPFLAFPDAGAYKRFNELVKKFNLPC